MTTKHWGKEKQLTETGRHRTDTNALKAYYRFVGEFSRVISCFVGFPFLWRGVWGFSGSTPKPSKSNFFRLRQHPTFLFVCDSHFAPLLLSQFSTSHNLKHKTQLTREMRREGRRVGGLKEMWYRLPWVLGDRKKGIIEKLILYFYVYL